MRTLQCTASSGSAHDLHMSASKGQAKEPDRHLILQDAGGASKAMSAIEPYTDRQGAASEHLDWTSSMECLPGKISSLQACLTLWPLCAKWYTLCEQQQGIHFHALGLYLSVRWQRCEIEPSGAALSFMTLGSGSQRETSRTK